MRLDETSNEELLAGLKSFVGTERQCLAKMIAYLGEVEDRRIYLELACSSMFAFCTTRLGFSEGEAFRRLTVARLVRRLPTLLEAIESGRVHLSSLVLLRDVLTEANVAEVLAAASGKTKREVEELVARMAAKPDVKPSIRLLPEAPAVADRRAPGMPIHSPSASPSLQMQPIAESRYKVQLTASKTLRDKLELARALTSHRNPSRDLAVVIEQAVDLLIEKLSKEKLGTTSRKRRAKPSTKPGYVTRATRREVFARDGFQCSFVAESGERCSSCSFLELDHVTPRALGGTSEPDNLRVLCRAHNRHSAERVFGRAHVEARIRSRRREPSRPVDGNAPFGEQRCFSQRKYEAPPAVAAPTIPSAAEALAPEASQRAGDHETRAQLRGALLALGFRSSEADRAVVTLGHGDDDLWRRPIETILREALGILT